MQEDKKKNLEVRSLYNIFTTLALILLLLAGTLTYLSSAVDVSAITEPFNTLSAETKKDIQNTKGIGDMYEKVSENTSDLKVDPVWGVSNSDVDTQKVTGVKGDAQDKAQEQSEKRGPMSAIGKAQMYYIKFKLIVEKVENYIAQIPYKPLIVVALLLLFALKGFISITPISFTCFLSGVIFPFWGALIINLIGIAYIFSVKYYKGKKSEKNTIHKYITKWDRLGTLIEDSDKGNGTGNAGLLFVLRLAPSVPINPVSQLYGYMGFRYPWFLATSLAGYLIKLVTFTSVGSNIADPFSAKFIVPILLILYASGLAMAVLAVIYRVKINLLAEPVETY